MLGQFISAEQYVCPPAEGRKCALPLPNFECGTSAGCSRVPFLVSHRPADHSYPALARLFVPCRGQPSSRILFRVEHTPGDAELDTFYDSYKRGLTLQHTIDHFDQRQAGIRITNPGQYPDYRPVIEALLAQFAARIDLLDPGMTWYSAHIFISARDSITPYPMDREMNFLLQFRGGKTGYLWNTADSEVMSEALRDFLLTYVRSRPPFKPAIEWNASIFDLRRESTCATPLSPRIVSIRHRSCPSRWRSPSGHGARRRPAAERRALFNARLQQPGPRFGPVGRVDDKVKNTATWIWGRAHRMLPDESVRMLVGPGQALGGVACTALLRANPVTRGRSITTACTMDRY